MAIPIPDDVRELLEAPNYVHLSTLRADASPRNWVVWAGLENDPKVQASDQTADHIESFLKSLSRTAADFL